MTQYLENLEDLSGFFNGVLFLVLGLFISWGTLAVRGKIRKREERFWPTVFGSTAVLGCAMASIAGFLWWCDPLDVITDLVISLGIIVFLLGMFCFALWTTT